MKKFFLFGSMIAAMLIFSTQASHAQVTYLNNGALAASSGTATQTGTVTTEITGFQDLSVTNGGTVDFNFNTLALLDAGIEHDGATVLTFRSNEPWFVNVSAGSDFTSATKNTTIPSTVLQYKVGTNAWATMGQTAQSLTGTSGSPNAIGSGTIAVDYKMNPGYVYSPADDYTLTLTYTISHP